VNVASFVHLLQALKHLACYVRNRPLPWEMRESYISFQGRVNVLKVDVLCTLHKADTVITDHSVTLFVIHHEQIILLLGNYGATTLHALHILYLNGNLLI
jgi:hypothetical protein